MFRLLFLLLTVQAAVALEVRETRWGFDGKTVLGQFNLFSVLVSEPGPKAFEGELILSEERGGLKVGAPYVQPIFVSPGTSRWVQFLPFVSESNPWRLSWGKGAKQTLQLDEASAGAPGTVLFMDLTSTFAQTARLKAFPEDLFPTSVAATDALDQAVLDHVPRWDALRREAFLDWVRKGGIVHLLRGPGGHPVFQDDLAVLNVRPDGRGKVGAGIIRRHDIGRDECDEKFLAEAGFPGRTLKKYDTSAPVLYRFDQTLMGNLASLTKPDVQWWLLYLLTLGYLIVIGPVHYRWSRKVDYRLAIGGFLGTVAVFAIAFIVAGHRGSEERQTSHAMTIARSLGGNRWDALEWVSAFATKGDFYRLSHEANSNFYSVPADAESVNGRCVGGKDGHLDVDIPLFSARPFMHRAVMNGPSAAVRITEWKSDRLEFELASDFPADVLQSNARWRQQVLILKRDGRKLSWSRGAPNATAEASRFFKDSGSMVRFDTYGGSFQPANAFIPLFARALGDVDGMPNAMTARPLAPDHLQLLLFATSPESFALKGKGFDHGHGHALYLIDLFRPNEQQP